MKPDEITEQKRLAQLREEEMLKLAVELGVPGNTKLAESFDHLRQRIAVLAMKVEKLEGEARGGSVLIPEVKP